MADKKTLKAGNGRETRISGSKRERARKERLREILAFLSRPSRVDESKPPSSAPSAQEVMDSNPRLCMVPEPPAHLALAERTPMSETGTYQMDGIEFDENGCEIERRGPPPLPKTEKKR